MADISFMRKLGQHARHDRAGFRMKGKEVLLAMSVNGCAIEMFRETLVNNLGESRQRLVVEQRSRISDVGYKTVQRLFPNDQLTAAHNAVTALMATHH